VELSASSLGLPRPAGRFRRSHADQRRLPGEPVVPARSPATPHAGLPPLNQGARPVGGSHLRLALIDAGRDSIDQPVADAAPVDQVADGPGLGELAPQAAGVGVERPCVALPVYVKAH
jgi:hypothetical protein